MKREPDVSKIKALIEAAEWMHTEGVPIPHTIDCLKSDDKECPYECRGTFTYQTKASLSRLRAALRAVKGGE